MVLEKNKSTINDTFNKRKNNTLLIICMIKLILACIAFSLCWDCNSREHIIQRIFATLIAVIFSPFYIVYYSIYRVVMGNKCY
jgi:hypothetical protein